MCEREGGVFSDTFTSVYCVCVYERERLNQKLRRKQKHGGRQTGEQT